MIGRKPQSTATKVLRGNPGKRALNHEEPQHPPPDPAFDTPPPELEHNLIAATEWARLAPLLREARQVTDTDRTALIALCLEWARYLEATAKVAKLGMVVKTPNDYPIPNPYLSIATKALSGCNKLWPELGLTPSSRSRIRATPEATSTDPFAEFDTPPPAPGPRSPAH